VRGVAYARVDEVIKHHPLFGQLQQLNDAIAAINLEATLPHAPLTPAQIAAQTQELNKELKAAQDRANAAINAKQQEYAKEERDADVAALKAAGIDPAAAGIGQVMNADSQQQAVAAAQAAQQGFQQYQQSVVSQDQAAMQSIVSQLNKQADDKFRARAEQYQQQENDLSLQLAQQDAPQRLAIKTKMNNLAMDPDSRKAAESEMEALDKKENDQVAALHAQHVAALSDYKKQLTAETSAQINAQLVSIRSQTSAKLSARGNEVRAQLQGIGGAPVPRVNIPANVQQQLGQIHQKYQGLFQADAQKVVSEYNATKSDLDAEFDSLHGANVGAVGAAAKQLRDLQQRHDALQAQILDQIQREAERLAKNMGFSIVLDNVQAAPGGYDLTNDLIHDVESLHE
jgi:Skp family chaperone for outer membrane proteins